MFTVAVLGGSGLLGRAIVNELKEKTEWRVVSTAFRRADSQLLQLDIRDAAAVERFVEREKPDAIIIAAAERRPDVCELEPERAYAVNVSAVRNVAMAASRANAWILSISTDYVFDGTCPPYRPNDRPHPLNAYGRSKLDGENALLDNTRLGCVLRLPLLYGPTDDWYESAVTSLVPAIKASTESTPAVMDAWATRYPTYTPDVAFVIRQLLALHAGGESLTGIAHWSGDQPMTKFDIAVRLATALQIERHIIPQTCPDNSTPRPRDCHLDSSCLEELGIGRRTPFETAIREVLKRNR